MIIDSEFNPNSVLHESRESEVLPGNQSIDNQTAVANYYKEINPNNNLVNQTLANELASSFPLANTINNGTSVTEINKQLINKLPTLNQQLQENQFRVIAIKNTALINDEDGNLSIRVVVQENKNNVWVSYKTDGTTTTNLNNAGKLVMLNGFKSTKTTIINYYQAINDTITYALSDTTTKEQLPSAFSVSSDLTNGTPLVDINKLLTTPLPTLDSTLTKVGYQVMVVKDTDGVNDSAGSLKLRVIVQSKSTVLNSYDTTGLISENSTNAGKIITITGFKSAQATVTSYYQQINSTTPFTITDTTVMAQLPSAYSVSSDLNNGTSLADVNNVLSNKLPALDQALVQAGYQVVIVKDTNAANDQNGSLTIRVIVQQKTNGSLVSYKDDGSQSTNLSEAGKQTTLSGFNSYQKLVQSFYNNVNQTYSLADGNNESQGIPSQTSIGATTDLNTLNNLLTATVKLPSLDPLLTGFNVIINKGTPDNNKGSIPYKIVVTQASAGQTIYYNSDGSVGTDASAGKDFTVTGYATLPSLVTSYYNNISQAASNSKTTAKTDNVNVAATAIQNANNTDDLIAALNTYLSSKLSPFFGQFKSLNYKLSATNINPNSTTGVLTFNLQIQNDQNQALNTDGTIAPSGFSGTAFSISGFPQPTPPNPIPAFNLIQNPTLNYTQLVGDNWGRYRVNIPGIVTKQQMTWYLQEVVANKKQTDFVNQIVALFNNNVNGSAYLVSFNPEDITNRTSDQARYDSTGATLIAGGRGFANGNGMNSASKINGITGLKIELNNLLTLSSFAKVDDNNSFKEQTFPAIGPTTGKIMGSLVANTQTPMIRLSKGEFNGIPVDNKFLSKLTYTANGIGRFMGNTGGTVISFDPTLTVFNGNSPTPSITLWANDNNTYKGVILNLTHDANWVYVTFVKAIYIPVGSTTPDKLKAGDFSGQQNQSLASNIRQDGYGIGNLTWTYPSK
ncbi:hypothetical protein [[Mycoplasma] testudinis]|uniref:hypothetical protein n=1 Tax=[Mycoplasma] testudinis TaxID=33924 RepID=UPI000482E02E|nr:hypothetical protein [[Mycoplasma] testudinis]